MMVRNLWGGELSFPLYINLEPNADNFWPHNEQTNALWEFLRDNAVLNLSGGAGWWEVSDDFFDAYNIYINGVLINNASADWFIGESQDIPLYLMFSADARYSIDGDGITKEIFQ